jgi:hypothetical protein
VDIDGVNQVALFSNEPNFDEEIVRRLVLALNFCFSFIPARVELPFKEIRFYHDTSVALVYLLTESRYYKRFIDENNCFFDVLRKICGNLGRKDYRIFYFLEGEEQ